MSTIPEETIADLRQAIENSYEKFPNDHLMMDNLPTRIAYYTMAINAFTKVPFKDEFVQKLMLMLLEELLSDAKALIPYEIHM